MGRLSLWALLGLTMLALSLHDAHVKADVGPTESECRPYIEKALHELKAGEVSEQAENDEAQGSEEDTEGEPVSADRTTHDESGEATDSAQEDDTEEATTAEADEKSAEDNAEPVEQSEEETKSEDEVTKSEEKEDEATEEKQTEEEVDKSGEEGETVEGEGVKSEEAEVTKSEEEKNEEATSAEQDGGEDTESEEKETQEQPLSEEEAEKGKESKEETEATPDESEEVANEEQAEDVAASEEDQTAEEAEAADESEETAEGEDSEQAEQGSEDDEAEEAEEEEIKARAKRSVEQEGPESQEDHEDDTQEEESAEADQKDEGSEEADQKSAEATEESAEAVEESTEKAETEEVAEASAEEKDEEESEEEEPGKAGESDEEDTKTDEGSAEANKTSQEDEKKDEQEEEEEEEDAASKEEPESQPEDDLLLEVEIPENLRDRKHIDELLHLDEEFEEREKAVDYVAEIILRDLKRIYENAIKPLETLYKYRDLSNRHFGDPEIFSKPLVLFMGPWSGGKSTIINYLTGIEYTENSLTAGAEPSPAYFNILMWSNETEVLDGTQLAADWTFSGLQKFGQGLEDRLHGLKFPNKLLEKVNIVEIPGILEVRKQVSRLFPFNDACQWFIDRADIIFLVYDPAKLDVGPETEAILDQLKGREYQTRIILNKADHVKPEELLRVQSALIWNISPLMSSAQPPVMYTTSLWSHPYEPSAPVRLLQAQERAFLRDLRGAIDKRIENKIASARRFAVRVRNHAKMVDCYLTTYYNHKTLFGNKKRISDQIIENPQNYHIYEGLSTLTNISRYDLPDPEVYRDFFRLNPLYEFKKLSETCTYFRGCPINKLDVAIAYDLPELVGKYKKMTEASLSKIEANDSDKGKS